MLYILAVVQQYFFLFQDEVIKGTSSPSIRLLVKPRVDEKHEHQGVVLMKGLCVLYGRENGMMECGGNGAFPTFMSLR